MTSSRRALTPEAWAALTRAESLLYEGQEGVFGITEVATREWCGPIPTLWDRAAEAVADACLEPHTAEVARRVALANAILVFGPEFGWLHEAASVARHAILDTAADGGPDIDIEDLDETEPV